MPLKETKVRRKSEKRQLPFMRSRSLVSSDARLLAILYGLSLSTSHTAKYVVYGLTVNLIQHRIPK